MATTRRKTAKKTAKRTAKKTAKKTSRRRGGSVGPTSPLGGATDLAQPDLATRLTDEILEIDRAGKRRIAQDVVEIGQRLLKLQHHLGFGGWLQWLSTRLPYSPRTAQRYMWLTQWASAHADDFERFAHLGISKLHLLAQLPERERRKFRQRRSWPIPGSNQRKTLDVMTHVELGAVLQGSDDLQLAPPNVPIDTVVQRFRHRVAALDALTDTLRTRADEVEQHDVEQLHAELLAVAEELAETFDL